VQHYIAHNENAAMKQSLKRYLPYLLILLLLLIAAGLRFYNLGAQSFWYDEGVAYGHSQRSLWEMIPRLQNNVHVPAYFGSLALWEDFTGSSEFALRYYSALWSILSVAVTYALGKRLFHPMVGVVAAFFVSFNGFSIYYAQETRMYAMLAAVGALAMWAFVRFVQLAMQPYHGEIKHGPMRDLGRWALAFALLNALGEYTHVSYALVMLSQGVMALLMLGNLAWRVMQGKIPFSYLARIFGLYVFVNFLSLIVFAPWIGVAISQTGAQPNISDIMPLSDVLQIIQGWFGFGISFEEGIGGMSGVMYALLVFGLLTIPNSRKNAWWALWLPIIWLLLSVGGYLALNLYARYLRFLLPAQIAFVLCLGRGAWALWEIVPRHPKPLTRLLPKFTALVAVLAIGWTQFSLLPALYHNARYQRDDYRGLAQQIENQAGENDAVILSSAGLQEIFGYYYHGTAPVYPLPVDDNIAADTQAVIDSADVIYVVFYGEGEQDPQHLVEGTLNANAFPIDSQWIGDVRFLRYASPVEFATPRDVHLLFGEHIYLQSYALSDTSLSPNGVLRVQLRWTTDALLETRYKVFLQLLNSDGALVVQRDTEPGGNQAFTSLWQVAEIIEDNHALALPNLPAGDYSLILGLYDTNNPSARLIVGEGDYFVLATITIGE
jgi:mannosyltransferase